ncbi:MAG: glycosyltransferase [Betaproteobacteria bacterium]
MPPIAVLHVTSAEGGGADRYVRDLAETTAARHWIWHAGAGIVEEVAARRFHRVPDGDAELARWVGGAGVGLVHLHGVTADDATALSRVRAARPLAYVVTLHDMGFVAPAAFEGDLAVDAAQIARVTPLLGGAAKLVAPSAFIASLVERHFPGIGVTLIAPGIGPRSATIVATAPVPPDFDAHARTTRVAVVGAIGPHKGSAGIEAIARALAAQDSTLVVIGYTDTLIAPGWMMQGELFVHGAYEDGALPGLLDTYGIDVVLFANRLPESFSYTLSEAWAAGRPVIVPDAGALGERVAQLGGGWRLPAGFDAQDVAKLVARLHAPDGAREWAQVESAIDIDDPVRIPPLAAMTQAFDSLYAQYAQPAGDTGGADALAPLVAANLDGRVFRRELVRLTGELAESRAWRSKLDRDIAELKDAIERISEDNRKLAEVRDAFELMPRLVRKLLLKLRQAFRGRR